MALEFVWVLFCLCGVDSLLYPRDSESRDIKELNGMWDFRADKSISREEGFTKHWYQDLLKQSGEVIPMAVPSSYNDVTEDKSLRDFIGWVWYDREFYVSHDWKNKNVMLRFDSAHYYTKVWLNGKPVMNHVGGHLPFEASVQNSLLYGEANRVTVAVNNTLTPTTLPPGKIHHQNNREFYPPGHFTQELNFDFFNYAGIHRSVRLYTTPLCYVSDITIKTDFSGTTGVVDYAVNASGQCSNALYHVEILDDRKKPVANTTSNKGVMKIQKVNLWWPYTISKKDKAYLYTLKVSVKSGSSIDVYRQPFGVRTVKVTKTKWLINDKPFYCHGFGKHEDADIRGKGLDYPLIAKDFNLIKWVGGNCFRTSHYPYAEEIMDQADQQGVVVIDESPGVGIKYSDNMKEVNLAHHKEVMAEMISRDKNRPSVAMWSVANEPSSSLAQADHYFGSVINYTRILDPTRPVTFVKGGGGGPISSDKVAKYVDIVCVNYYFGWYINTGQTESIQKQLEYTLIQWNKIFQRPVILSEYGAEAITGLHMEPSFLFTEEYQVDVIKEYFKGFDNLRKDFLVGEMIWNFADFMTAQELTRVVGNKKGIFTRQRQPKWAAHVIRERYIKLANETRNF